MDSITKQITQLRAGEELSFCVSGKQVQVWYRMHVQDRALVEAINAAEHAGVISATDASQKRHRATIVRTTCHTLSMSMVTMSIIDIVAKTVAEVIAEGRSKDDQ